MRSAFARLVRNRELSSVEHARALRHLNKLRLSWREIEPTIELRTRAESLLDRFPLTAADSLQLAAALAWCGNRPQGRLFVSEDKQLLTAANQLGFHSISA